MEDFLQRAVEQTELRCKDRHLTEMIIAISDGDSPKVGDVIVRIDPRYFRPTEVETLLGDASKAREQLGWQPTTSFNYLVKEMVHKDLDQAERFALLKREGFDAHQRHE